MLFAWVFISSIWITLPAEFYMQILLCIYVFIPFLSLKRIPKRTPKRGGKSSFYVWASLHALSHLSISAIPSSKPEWISCSLLHARLLCYLYYKSVKQTNKGTTGTVQWGYTHEGCSQQPNQGENPVIRDKKTFKGREGSEATAAALTQSISSHTRNTGSKEQLYPCEPVRKKANEQ